MALFQIFKGNEDTLSNVGLHEGYAYFCVDSGKMFIDIASTGEMAENRVPVSASTPYTDTLYAANWVAAQDGRSYTYNYINPALRCGPNGDVPPIVTYTTNQEEYNYIDNAEATAGSGIVFTASERPASNISIIVIDLA